MKKSRPNKQTTKHKTQNRKTKDLATKTQPKSRVISGAPEGKAGPSSHGASALSHMQVQYTPRDQTNSVGLNCIY